MKAGISRILAAGLGLFVVVFVLSSISIYKSIKSISESALSKYSGDRVEALIEFVESEENDLKERNRAIWALGQLGDRRAQPVLEKYLTEDPGLNKYELKKAVRYFQGYRNIYAKLWKSLFLKE